jgi:hypothetical protein
MKTKRYQLRFETKVKLKQSPFWIGSSKRDAIALGISTANRATPQRGGDAIVYVSLYDSISRRDIEQWPTRNAPEKEWKAHRTKTHFSSGPDDFEIVYEPSKAKKST